MQSSARNRQIGAELQSGFVVVAAYKNGNRRQSGGDETYYYVFYHFSVVFVGVMSWYVNWLEPEVMSELFRCFSLHSVDF